MGGGDDMHGDDDCVMRENGKRGQRVLGCDGVGGGDGQVDAHAFVRDCDQDGNQDQDHQDHQNHQEEMDEDMGMQKNSAIGMVMEMRYERQCERSGSRSGSVNAIASANASVPVSRCGSASTSASTSTSSTTPRPTNVLPTTHRARTPQNPTTTSISAGTATTATSLGRATPNTPLSYDSFWSTHTSAATTLRNRR